MSRNTDTLNELIEILRDGRTFYDEAATKVVDPELRTLFHEISTSRAAAIIDLIAEVRSDGEKPATGGTLRGILSQAYANALAAITSDKDTTYVNQLESAEDRLMLAFDVAIEDTDNSRVREILGRHAPEIRRMHAQMRNEKLSRII